MNDVLTIRPGVPATPETQTPQGEAPADRVEQPYRPIRDYALIGDCHGAALVCRDGSIDWCCLGRFDAGPVFARILDAERGGCFELAPFARCASLRRYLGETAILETEFLADEGSAILTDFMPVGCRPGSSAHNYTSLNAPGAIVRLVRGRAGSVRFRLRYAPIRGFDDAPVPLAIVGGLVTGAGVPALQGEAEFALDGLGATAEFTVSEGETRAFILSPAPLSGAAPSTEAHRLLDVTRAFWEEWLGYCRYKGPYRTAVRRSAITLKLLTFAPSGAVIAAPTTSLPEWIGAERNWDYRFCWLRDSSFTLYALAALGYSNEACRFVDFLKARHLSESGVRLMYGVGGETDLTERLILNFAGYRSSKPVRTGNAAHQQLQTDIFGETLDLALLYQSLGGTFDREERAALAFLADRAVALWREPDNGIWEMRTDPRHFVYSKVMCWVAVDRAIRLFGKRAKWVAAKREIVAEVRRHGIAPEGHLVQAYGWHGSDAALLIVPWLGFPIGEEVLQATVRAALKELRAGEYLRRYRLPDGIPSDEGAFLMGSFWLADALLYLGETADAEALYAALLSKANDVGLFAEEVEPRSHAFLGNFPQGLVHLAAINSAIRLERRRESGHRALVGTAADRARRHVDWTAGPAALWTTLKKAARVGRLTHSTRSILALP